MRSSEPPGWPRTLQSADDRWPAPESSRSWGERADEAEPLLREAIEILARAGARAEAASAEAHLGNLLFSTNRIEEAVTRLEGALAGYESEADETATATVSAQLSRFLFFEGRPEEALPHAERALELAERLRLAPVVVQALINKALIVSHRPNESLGLVRQALVLAEESGDDFGALRACMNLSHALALADRLPEAQEAVEHGIALARRRGDRRLERSLTANLVSGYWAVGQWDEAERAAAEIPGDGSIVTDPVHATTPLVLATIALARGDDERAAALVTPFTSWRGSARVQARGIGALARALRATAEGLYSGALAECITALSDEQILHAVETVNDFVEVGGEAAWTERDPGGLAEILGRVAAAPHEMPASLEARVLLQRARLAVLRDDPEPAFEPAVAAFRAVNDPFWVATALLEQAEWLADNGGAGEIEPLLAEAREVFERLRAQPRLERVERLEAAAGVAT